MSLDIFKLDGKVAWITGGTKGLGLAMANALAGAGADIVVSSRHEDEALSAAKSIANKHGRRTLGLKADVAQENEVNDAVENIVKDFGKIDILINNAGVNVRLPTLELPLEEWQKVVDINLTGPFLCTKAVVPHMLKEGWGRIINMSSMLGQVGLSARPAYTATKGGLLLMTKAHALEYATQGITVNAICPGPFGTDMNKPLMDDPEKYNAFISKIPMGRWGNMDELDGVVIFLASNASSFVTGTSVLVDGGWTAW